MNEQLIKAKHEPSLYELKEGTTSSYYLKEGKRNLLPERLTFSKEGFKVLKHTGRLMTEKKVGQLAGTFKVKEESCYKLYKPFSIFSSIFEAKDYPLFIGYGDIGLSKEGPEKPERTKDLFILYSPGKGTLEVHLFKGLLEFKEPVLAYLKGYILDKGKSPRMGF